MKKFVLMASLAAVAACSQAETAPEAEVTEEIAEAAQPLALDGKATPGIYKITRENGDVFMEEVRADGSYTATMPDGSVENGTWEQPSPDVFCSTSDEEGAAQECADEKYGDNGEWLSTGRETGNTLIVERVEV